MTLEKLIEELRAAAGANTLTVALTREQAVGLVEWFETARKSIADTATYAVELRDDLMASAVADAIAAEREACAALVEAEARVSADGWHLAELIRLRGTIRPEGLR